MKRILIAATLAGVSLSFATAASAASHAKKKPDSAAMPAGDAAKGKKIYRKCKACHAVGKTAKNKVGPVLNGVNGRKVATFAGYKYSKAMKAAGEKGMIWDDKNLDAYLTKPKKFIPKTKMSFAGIKKADQRADLIAYLATFK